MAKKRSVFLRPLKNKGCKEDRVAKVGANGLDNSTTLESNKSLSYNDSFHSETNRRFSAHHRGLYAATKLDKLSDDFKGSSGI